MPGLQRSEGSCFVGPAAPTTGESGKTRFAWVSCFAWSPNDMLRGIALVGNLCWGRILPRVDSWQVDVPKWVQGHGRVHFSAGPDMTSQASLEKVNHARNWDFVG